MEKILLFIKVIIWWIIFDLSAAAGIAKNPFFLILSIVLMTYWYWRYPVFKKEEKQED